MAGLLSRLFSRNAPATQVPRTTTREDWDTLGREIFARVVQGCRFCIGVIVRDDGAGGELHYRLNQEFPNPAVPEFVHRNVGPDVFAAFFPARQGLKVDRRRGLLVVADDRLGLPKKTLVCPIAHAHQPERQALLLFGGERLEGQLEARLQALESVLAGRPAAAEKAAAGSGGAEGRRAEFLQALEKLDTKRLFDHDLDTLAEIVNGLDDIKEELPLNLKPKFGAVSKYLLQKRIKGGGGPAKPA